MDKTIDDVSTQALGAFFLFDEIDTPVAKDVCEFIYKYNKSVDTTEPITIFINSPGGTMNDGFAIVDMMVNSKIPVSTVSTGLIASMAVLIAAAGTKGHRFMTKNTSIMAHQFSAEAYGKQHELIALNKSFKKIEQQIIKHFLAHTTMTEQQIRDILFCPTDTYLTPAECKKYGIIDKIISSL